MLEEQIIVCEERNCGLVVEMDCNAKLGKDIIKGDPHEMSSNGKLLWDIVQRRECTVVNTMDQCCGVITRSRMKGKVKEESILDFVIVNQTMVPFVEEMEIDESKAKALTRFKKSKAVPSDHNYIRCTFEINVEQRKERRHEVYCLRNENDLQVFKEKTSTTNKFSRCFTDNGNIDKEGKRVTKRWKLMILVHSIQILDQIWPILASKKAKIP